MGQLSGKVAIVTGAAMGLGQTTARLFASEGAAVVIADAYRAGREHTAATINDDEGR